MTADDVPIILFAVALILAFVELVRFDRKPTLSTLALMLVCLGLVVMLLRDGA